VGIGEERARLKSELAAQGPLLEAGAALIRAALDLLDSPQELYRRTTDPVRRQLNQVFFDKLYLDADEITGDILSELFDAFQHERS
jgi:site-specific DNA recombinase